MNGNDVGDDHSFSAGRGRDSNSSNTLNTSTVQPTYSLRTLFFIVTCAAVFFAGLRTNFGISTRFILGAAFLSGFVAIWSFVRGWHQLRWMSLIASVLFGFTFIAWARDDGFRCGLDGRVYCMNYLQQIGRALVLYEQDHGALPPAYSTDAQGSALCSWRAYILPYFEMKPVFDLVHFDEPWNSRNNGPMAAVFISHLQCPLSKTDYLAVIGPKAAWAGATGRNTSEFKHPATTILVLEVPSSLASWLQPRDVTAEQLRRTGLQGLIPRGGDSPHPEGFNALFADGHVESLPVDIDPKVLARMLDINSAENAGQ